MKAGPQCHVRAPGDARGLAASEIEVIDPLPIEFSQASPQIIRSSEAMQWVERPPWAFADRRRQRQIYVLETIDAIDLPSTRLPARFSTAEIDTSGYPEYNAVVGGVASHWDDGHRRHAGPGGRPAGAAAASARRHGPGSPPGA